VRSQGAGFSASLAYKEFGHGVVEALVEKGLVALEWVRLETLPAADFRESAAQAHGAGEATPPLTLIPEQADALARISEALDHPQLESRSFLLHGVTGSGKTEVYLQAMQHVVNQGQQAIFLVPEIALTPQTLHRVNARFPGRVAVIHSQLTSRQKFDQWWNIRNGNYHVVVGPRSALFAPLPHLGLIIIDEEHEWTYKQEEFQPLYHTRTVALKLSQLTGAVVVLGSATPDVETYYHAQQGSHRLLELPHRVRQAAMTSVSELATVEICNMRQELQEGNRSIFSRQLTQALKGCVSQGQQAILFLNRRGSAPIVQCRDCGYVVTCRHCAVSLTYHAIDSRLLCHHCNRSTLLPRSCRQCGGGRIRQLGVGTQRVVDEVAALLPGVRVQRWDADATRAGLDPAKMMPRLDSGEIQVLVGTQMVAKGLHLPNVTLVGVVLADIGLHLPDFRAGERAFSLLCQVAGRAGRGDAGGRVIIQTYLPEHYAIVAAAGQDYMAMYQREIESRRQQGNPPFNQLVHLVYQHTSATLCQRQATTLARLLRQKTYARGLTNVDIIGPAPGIPQRSRGHYRWHLTVRGRELQAFLDSITLPQGWMVDVDPAHLL
jgi:primosomal protein N' (replication factor Y)